MAGRLFGIIFDAIGRVILSRQTYRYWLHAHHHRALPPIAFLAGPAPHGLLFVGARRARELSSLFYRTQLALMLLRVFITGQLIY